eukprot:scaffold7086_cov120-Isochrysis_galbana.AAC.7
MPCGAGSPHKAKALGDRSGRSAHVSNCEVACGCASRQQVRRTHPTRRARKACRRGMQSVWPRPDQAHLRERLQFWSDCRAEIACEKQHKRERAGGCNTYVGIRSGATKAPRLGNGEPSSVNPAGQSSTQPVQLRRPNAGGTKTHPAGIRPDAHASIAHVSV